MHHKLTRQDCRKGGWTRARQWAELRRSSPTTAESIVRKLVQSRLSPEFILKYEYEIVHATGQPQFFDLAILCNDQLIAMIECDGSRGYHNPCYPGSKMFELDEQKRAYCNERNIKQLWVSIYDDNLQSAIIDFMKGIENDWI